MDHRSPEHGQPWVKELDENNSAVSAMTKQTVLHTTFIEPSVKISINHPTMSGCYNGIYQDTRILLCSVLVA